MQALIRVQTRVCQQRAKKVAQHEQKATYSTDDSGAEEVSLRWDDQPRTVDNIRAFLHRTKNVALRRENEMSLAHAFTHQVHYF